jgi:hypothetical protein
MLATDRHLPTAQSVVETLASHLLYHGLIPVTRWGCVCIITSWQWELMRPMVGREN